jgi:hypothetical protein
MLRKVKRLLRWPGGPSPDIPDIIEAAAIMKRLSSALQSANQQTGVKRALHFTILGILFLELS